MNISNNPLSATRSFITSIRPKTNNETIVNKVLFYPNFSNNRIDEGGMRLNGLFKNSLPNLPLVTVITVSLNAEKTIKQTIDSVVQQTYKNIEYIVIDGGSSDKTLSIIKKCSEEIDYFISEKDRGIYHAMNKGLMLAGGQYILLLNSDDWYEKGCIESLLNAKLYSGADFVSALSRYVGQSGKSLYVLRSMPYDASLFFRMPLRHETMLISASIYNDIGYYDEEYKIISDYDLTIKLFEADYSHYEVNKPLLNFRNTGESNLNKKILISERKSIISRRFPFLSSVECEKLANIRDLTPEYVQNLLSRYHDQKIFAVAFQLYSLDRKLNTNEYSWNNADLNLLFTNRSRPEISVILPVYNAENTLAVCIESVLSQTFKNIELICINDESPDKSQDIINNYKEVDSRIISFINEKNIGLGASRNKGIRYARGKYIFHIDPDDSIPASSLETLYSTATKYDSDIVKGSYLKRQYMHAKKGYGTERKELKGVNLPIINTNLNTLPQLMNTTEGHWSFLYKSTFIKTLCYPTDLKMGQDSLFLIGALISAKKISIIDQVIYHYNANSASAMNTFTFRKYMDAIEWRRRAWHLLDKAELRYLGDGLLNMYWSDAFFYNLANSVSYDEFVRFLDKLKSSFEEACIISSGNDAGPLVQKILNFVINNQFMEAYTFLKNERQEKKNLRKLLRLKS